jgi:hypothetical protein
MKCLFQRSFFTLDFVKDRFIFTLMACMSFICVQSIFLTDAGSEVFGESDGSLVSLSLSSASSGGYRSDRSSASIDSEESFGGAGAGSCGVIKHGYDDPTLKRLLRSKLASDFFDLNVAWFDDEMPFGLGNGYQELRMSGKAKSRDSSRLAVLTETTDNIDTGISTHDIYIYPLPILTPEDSDTEPVHRFMKRRCDRYCTSYDEPEKDAVGIVEGASFKKAFNWVQIPITPRTRVYIPCESKRMLANDFIPGLFKRKSTATILGKLRDAGAELLPEPVVAHAVCTLICYNLFAKAVFVPFVYNTFLPARILDAGHLMLISNVLFKKDTAEVVAKELPYLFEKQCAMMARLVCLWFIYGRIDKDTMVGLLQFLRNDRGSREAERLLVLIEEPVSVADASPEIVTEFDLKHRVEGALEAAGKAAAEAGKTWVGVPSYIDALKGVRKGLNASRNQIFLLTELCKMAYMNRKRAPYAVIALLDIIGSYAQPTVDEAFYVATIMEREVSRAEDKDEGLLSDIQHCREYLSEKKKHYDFLSGVMHSKIGEVNNMFEQDAQRRERERFERYTLRTPTRERQVNLDAHYIDFDGARKPLLKHDMLEGSVDEGVLTYDDSTSAGEGRKDRGFGSVGSASGSSTDGEG